MGMDTDAASSSHHAAARRGRRSVVHVVDDPVYSLHAPPDSIRRESIFDPDSGIVATKVSHPPPGANLRHRKSEMDKLARNLQHIGEHAALRDAVQLLVWVSTRTRCASSRRSAPPPWPAGVIKKGQAYGVAPGQQNESAGPASHAHANLRGPPGPAQKLVTKPYSTSEQLGLGSSAAPAQQSPASKPPLVDRAAVRKQAEGMANRGGGGRGIGSGLDWVMERAACGGHRAGQELLETLDRQLDQLARELKEAPPVLTDGVRAGQAMLGDAIEAGGRGVEGDVRGGDGAEGGGPPGKRTRARAMFAKASQKLGLLKEATEAFDATTDLVVAADVRRVRRGASGSGEGEEEEEEEEAEREVAMRLAEAAKQARRFRLLAPGVDDAKRAAMGMPKRRRGGGGR